MLQCVAVCCGMLRYVAICCDMLWRRRGQHHCVAVWCNVMQCVAVGCGGLQCFAVSKGSAPLWCIVVHFVAASFAKCCSAEGVSTVVRIH